MLPCEISQVGASRKELYVALHRRGGCGDVWATSVKGAAYASAKTPTRRAGREA